MNAATPPNIAATGSPLNRAGHLPQAPTRDEIAGATVAVLKAGSADKADVIVVDRGDGAVVVKDFAAKPWWGRWLGRLQIAREAAAYRHLDGVEGIPRFLGRVDALALAVEKIEGEQLAFHPRRLEDGPLFVTRLRALIDRIHERGVAHNDLRGRENVLVNAEGEVVVVDLAGAVRFHPGGIAHRLFFRLVTTADEAAFLKWKTLLAPAALTAADRAALARFRRLRVLWPFNRKRAAGGDA